MFFSLYPSSETARTFKCIAAENLSRIHDRARHQLTGRSGHQTRAFAGRTYLGFT
jgi:ribosomal protein L35